MTVSLSNGKSYGADLVISAIGVEPNTSWLPEEVKRDASDGGIVVDRCVHARCLICLLLLLSTLMSYTSSSFPCSYVFLTCFLYVFRYFYKTLLTGLVRSGLRHMLHMLAAHKLCQLSICCVQLFVCRCVVVAHALVICCAVLCCAVHALVLGARGWWAVRAVTACCMSLPVLSCLALAALLLYHLSCMVSLCLGQSQPPVCFTQPQPAACFSRHFQSWPLA